MADIKIEEVYRYSKSILNSVHYVFMRHLTLQTHTINDHGYSIMNRVRSLFWPGLCQCTTVNNLVARL